MRDRGPSSHRCPPERRAPSRCGPPRMLRIRLSEVVCRAREAAFRSHVREPLYEARALIMGVCARPIGGTTLGWRSGPLVG